VKERVGGKMAPGERSLGEGEEHDFFLSRRGAAAAVAREVEAVLTEKGYKVFVQDYDMPIGTSFIEAMHEAIKHSRDLIVLFTRDYETSLFTRREFASFEADKAWTTDKERRLIVLRCEDVPVRSMFAASIYQDLFDVTDPEVRRKRIIAAAEGHSQATKPRPASFHGVPPRIASFTGRLDELDRLDAILMKDRAAAVTLSVGRAAVQGLGGVGKTSLATEYAHRYRNLYAGVCWCPAETRVSLVTCLAKLAVELGLPSAGEGQGDAAAKSALRGLEKLSGTWLLIYDNVPSPDEINDLLPSQGTRVLITSRFSDWSELAGEVQLDVLPMKEAVAFLQSRTGRVDEKGATTLAVALGQLPLALNHAAAVCRKRGMSFVDYASKVASLIDTLPRGAAYPRSVKATFDLAIAEAVERRPACESLMAFLAYCGPDRIPLTLLERAMDDKNECEKALDELVDLSLAKQDAFEAGASAVTVHRLVRLVAIERLDAVARESALNKLVTALAAALSGAGRGSPLIWLLFPHLMEVLNVLNNEEHSESEARRYMDMLARTVVMALRFMEDKQLAKQIGPDYLAGVLSHYYEVDPLKGAIDLLLKEHREIWPRLQQEFLNANNYVLRYAMATCLADACTEPPASMTVEEVTALFDGARNINEFEMAGYALGMIYARRTGAIELAKLERLAKREEYPGRSILGDLFLNLVFREEMRGRDLRGLLADDRFWNPIWDFIKLDVWAIEAAGAFNVDEDEIAGDPSPQVRENFESFREIRSAISEMRSADISERINTLLADYWSLGRKKEDIDEAEQDFDRISDWRLLERLIRIFFAHPVWAVAEAAATMLSRLIESDSGRLEIIGDLLDDANWRVQFGANEACFAVRESFPRTFEDSVHRFHAHPISKIRGLCAENLFSRILNSSPEERARLLLEFNVEIRRWLMDDDCWVLDHVFCFFNKLHRRHLDITSFLSGELSPLFSQLPEWYSVERGAFLGHIERRREELAKKTS
jgi:TIR domain